MNITGQELTSPRRRGSLNSGLRQSRSDSNAVQQFRTRLHNPKTVGEHIRREKEKNSQKNIRKGAKDEGRDDFIKIVDFLNNEEIDPERMLRYDSIFFVFHP